jgi:hypothetical protein
VTSRQASSYAGLVRGLPQVKSATCFHEIGGGKDDHFVQVEDYMGNLSTLDDVCETRSLIAIWRDQARPKQFSLLT